MTTVKRISLLASAATLALGCGTALAQEERSAVAADGGGDVVVTGVRQSLAGALDIKRKSNQFVDALVAEDFAQFPDSNLGEALQRIPGITVDRSEGADQSNAIGEGGTINVRGLGADFTRTEINGMTATSPGLGRGFGFNVLASELFVQAQVSKSLTARDNEGGLAGTVGLKIYQPFDFSKRVLSVSARGTYASMSGAVTPAATLIFADTTKDGRLGIALGVNFDRTRPRDLSVDALNWDYVSDQYGTNFARLPAASQAIIGRVQSPRGPRIIENDREQDRLNATLSLQARPSDNLTLTFDNIYARLNHKGVQNRQGLSVLSSFTAAPTTFVTDGDRLVSGTFTTGSPVSSLINYEYDVQSTVYQGVFRAEWRVADNFVVTPSLGYSRAEEKYRKWNQITLLSAAADTVIGSTGDFTYYTTLAGDQANPAIYNRLFAVRNRPDRDRDEELAGRIDASLNFSSSILRSIEFGGRWARQTKTYDAYDGQAALTTSVTDFTPYITAHAFDFDGAPAGFPQKILGFDFDALRIATGTNTVVPVRVDTASYKVTEETRSGYAMATFDLGTISGNLGVRVVSTDQVSAGTQTLVAANTTTTLVPASFRNSYTYALPSLNARWEIHDGLVGRIAIYRSLTRPALTDIQPARRLPAFNGGTGTSGNPYLKPYMATNYDIGAEWYFGKDALVSLAYFRKDLNGLIETITEEVQVADPVSGQTLNVFLARPVQGSGAHVNGLEAGVQTPFSFLPGMLRNTGVVLNGTLTDSSANFSNVADIRTSTLPGLSKRSFNAIAYYDDTRLSARLAYNWRGAYLLQVAGSGGQPVSRDAYGQLDFGSSYRLTKAVTLRLDALNLTDARIRSFTDFDTAKAKALLQAGRKVVFGVSYKY